jgi:hypothetical protein
MLFRIAKNQQRLPTMFECLAEPLQHNDQTFQRKTYYFVPYLGKNINLTVLEVQVRECLHLKAKSL